ncbi:SRPBCC family protein [Microbacterium sediminicola]|uniref:SRPBCC family protein n=1 Tax=Microbacterium sediminicola TaxID=415210 RepID=A0ABN2HW52_9MICO
MTFPSRHISQAIQRSPREVIAFAGDPRNLPVWAAGLSAEIRQQDGRWITDSPMGEVEVRFTGEVELGILDHDVVLPDGTTVHNPLRVLANGDGSEVVFTLYRLPDATDAAYERDAAMVRDDLNRLRGLLEDDR